MIGYESLVLALPTLEFASLPTNTAAPLFTGTAATDQTLTGVIGTYIGTPTITITHQWQRYDAGAWSNISGATSIDYAIQAGDVGKTVRRAETATNTAGSITTYTAASDTVATSWYVSKSGNNSNDGLTPATAKLTLANALGAAGVPIGGNVVVWVDDGTYAENTAGRLLLNRAFTSRVLVKRQSATPHAVIVTGTGTDGSSISITSNAANVVFDGVDVEIASGSTICVWCTNNSTGINAIQFKNGRITNTASSGVGVQMTNIAGSNFLFENMEITATGTGSTAVSASGRSTSSRISGLRFVNCGVSGVARGLELDTQGWIDDLYISGTYESTRVSPAGLAIGHKAGGLAGSLTRVTIEGATVSGNGGGIELGGTSTGYVIDLTITDSHIDVEANKQIGVMLRGNITGLTYTGNYASGAHGASGMGGFASEGANTDFLITGSHFSSVEPTPGERCLAAGFGGVTGFVMRNCTYDGDGRAWTLQDNMHDVLCEDWVSTARDYGFRIGHDAVGSPHTTSDVTIRNFTITSTQTVGIVIGEGVWNVLIEDGVCNGGNGAVVIRGHATNDNILMRRVEIKRNPAGLNASSLIELMGSQNTTITDCDIENDTLATFSFSLEGALTVADTTVSNNRVILTGGSVYSIPVGTLGSRVVFDENAYTVSGGATFGLMFGNSVADLAAARTQWNGYGDGTNDDLSTAT